MRERCNIRKSYYFIGRLLLLSIFCYNIPWSTADCKLVDPSKSKEQKYLNALSPLKGLVFETKDAVESDHYSYKVSICDGIKGESEYVGAIQYTSQNNNYSLGRYDVAEIMGGTDWILLTYYNGAPYDQSCNKSNRTTKIIIICDPRTVAGAIQILEERKSDSSCYYLFEISSNVSCTDMANPKILPTGFSPGTVFCILFFTGATVYLVCGFLYKRIVIGAKGLEQIPNYTFWMDFGNLQADGCDYFCRWGPRRQSQAYRGIDDHLRTAEEERDDQLLNM